LKAPPFRAGRRSVHCLPGLTSFSPQMGRPRPEGRGLSCWSREGGKKAGGGSRRRDGGYAPPSPFMTVPTSLVNSAKNITAISIVIKPDRNDTSMNAGTATGAVGTVGGGGGVTLP